MPTIPTLTLNPALDLSYTSPGYYEGELVRAKSCTARAGGKGINVSRMLHRLGADTRAFCLLGGHTGRRMAAMLREEGIPFSAVTQRTETRINVYARAGADELRLNAEGAKPEAEAVAKIIARFEAQLRPNAPAVVAGTLPHGVAMRVVTDLLRRARKLGAHVWLDADDYLLESAILGRPFGIKPNREEFTLLADCCPRVMTFSEIVAAGRGLIKKHGVREILLTLDRDGAIWITADKAHKVKAVKRDPRHLIVGVGDMFLAAWLKARSNGADGKEGLLEASKVVSRNLPR